MPAYDVDFKSRLCLCGAAQAQRNFTDAAETCPDLSWCRQHPLAMTPEVLGFSYIAPTFALLSTLIFFPEKKKSLAEPRKMSLQYRNCC